MNNHYDVLIAGAGAAGLAAAAFSAKAGLRVLVCERAEKIGGLVGSFTHKGFVFDAGIRAFEDSGVISPMLRALDLPLEFVKNPVTVGIAGRSVRLTGEESLPAYAELFKSFYPEESRAIDDIMSEIVKVMRYMDVLYGVENPLFLESELKDPQYLSKILLPWLIKYSINIKKASKLDAPVRQYLLRFTKNQSLIDMICQHFFDETPTFFALSYFGLYLDYRYPRGGTGMLPAQLADYIRAHGGEIRTSSAVADVFPAAHKATLESGEEIHYRQLIWAADQRAFYRALREPLPKAVSQKMQLAEQSHGMDSILTLFIGTTLTPEELEARNGTHAFYTPKTDGLSSLSCWREAQREGLDALKRWVVSYLEKTTFEISVPALRDATLAPEEKAGLIVSTLFDYDLTKAFDEAGQYQQLKDIAQETILRVLDQSLLPRLVERTEFALCSTPLTIERETGALHGAITGWAHTNHPMPAEHDFASIRKAVETGVTDVLQCGMWTFSPAGLPVSLITGKLAADKAVSTLRKRSARA